MAAPQDLSDVFAVLEPGAQETTRPCATQGNSSSKKRRVRQMLSRTTSANGFLSPPLSPTHSSASGPVDLPTRLKPTDLLLASNPILAHVVCQSPSRPAMVTASSSRSLSRHVSGDMLSLPVGLDTINCTNLAAVLGPTGGLKKTYGGPRTFKDDDEEMNLLLPIRSDGPSSSVARCSPAAGSMKILNRMKAKPRETYSDLRKKWGVDEDEKDSEGSTDLRTISHQRAMGSSKRFVDELSYLFEGLSEGERTNDLEAKRLGAIELVSKLADQEYCQNLKANGMIEPFYEVLRLAGAGNGDIVLDLTLLVFISILSCEDQRFLEPILLIMPKDLTDPLSTQSDCLQVLAKLVNTPIDCGDTRGLGKRTAKQVGLRNPIPSTVLFVSHDFFLHRSGRSRSKQTFYVLFVTLA